MRMKKVVLASAVCGALVMLSGLGAANAQRPLKTLPLPSSVTYPEGVAYDPATNSLYAGSAVDGGLVRINAATGRVQPVTPPDKIAPKGSEFPAMLGMKHDKAGRLWIAGGWTGKVTVVDSKSGRILKQSTVSGAPKSLLNDLVLVGNTAYVTDTFVPTLWRVRVVNGKIGNPEPWIDLRKTPIEFGEGPNLNGIAGTADGRSLIVVQMNKGKLFRVDVATRKVTQIDIGKTDLTGTDGLVIDGRTLYAVRQWAGEVLTFTLDAKLSSATLRSRYSSPDLAYPSTAAKVGNELIIVNAQFDKQKTNNPSLPFGLVRVPLSDLQGRPGK